MKLVVGWQQWALVALALSGLGGTYLGVGAEIRSLSILQERRSTLHDYQTLLHDSLASLYAMNTSAHGYVLTGESAFLAVFEESESRLPFLLARLAVHARSLELGVSDSIELAALADPSTRLQRAAVDKRRLGPLKDAIQSISTGESEAMTLRMRRAYSDLRRLQETRAQELSLATQRAEQRVYIFAVSGAVGSFLVLLAAFVLLNRSLRHTRLLLNAVERHDRQLDALAVRLESVREDERAALARDLHDNMGQILTAIRMDLALVRRSPGLTPAALERLEAAARLTEEGVRQVRQLAMQLRPALLDQMGLIPALEWHATEFQRTTGVACLCRSGESAPRLAPAVELAVFRIAQEALTNIARHARASEARIDWSTSPYRMTVEVGDNGVGIPPGAADSPLALGILGMRERALHAGCQCEIVSKNGSGTTIRIQAPLPPTEASPHAA